MISNDRNKSGNPSSTYLLIDSNSKLLALGELTSPPDAPNMQLKLVEGSAEDVVAAEVVQAVPQDEWLPMRLGRVILRRGNQIVLDPLQDLSEDARQNLRMPVDFASFVYPRGGGRAAIRSLDLSCGGIAFYTAHSFQPHEQFEVVIPITDEGPLILKAEILRIKPRDGDTLYAAKFINMIHDEEAKVRGAVFHVQIIRNFLTAARAAP